MECCGREDHNSSSAFENYKRLKKRVPRYHADAMAAECDDSIQKPFDFDWLRTYLFRFSIPPLMPGGKGN
jgi:hypothetical protein